MNPDLTNQEIDEICDGLTQNAARVRYLQRMGLTVRIKPNGKPLVNRAHYDATMNGAANIASKTARAPAWRVPA